MIDQRNIHTVLLFITPGIIDLILQNHDVNEKQAARILYESDLYSKLEDKETGLWRLSSLALYDLLSEELATGKITWPEEQ